MQQQDEGPRFARRELANALLDMREDLHAEWGSDWTQAAVASRLGMSQQSLASIEGRRTVPSEDTLRALLREYGRENETTALLARRRRAKGRSPQWRGVDLTADPAGYADYVDYEGGAESIEIYENRLIPGNLQSEKLAKHVIERAQRSGWELDRKVSIRVGRREALTRENKPARLWACIEEHALTRPAAPPEIMREQYELLLELGALPNVEIQMIPHAVGAHVGMTSAFSRLRFHSPRDPGMVAIETEITTIFLERPAEIRQYDMIMDHLRAVALEPDATAARIDKLRKEVEA